MNPCNAGQGSCSAVRFLTLQPTPSSQPVAELCPCMLCLQLGAQHPSLPPAVGPLPSSQLHQATDSHLGLSAWGPYCPPWRGGHTRRRPFVTDHVQVSPPHVRQGLFYTHLQPVHGLVQARNYTARDLIRFVVPGQVTELKHQQFSGDNFYNELLHGWERSSVAEVRGGQMTRRLFHPLVLVLEWKGRCQMDGWIFGLL